MHGQHHIHLIFLCQGNAIEHVLAFFCQIGRTTLRAQVGIRPAGHDHLGAPLCEGFLQLKGHRQIQLLLPPAGVPAFSAAVVAAVARIHQDGQLRERPCLRRNCLCLSTSKYRQQPPDEHQQRSRHRYGMFGFFAGHASPNCFFHRKTLPGTAYSSCALPIPAGFPACIQKFAYIIRPDLVKYSSFCWQNYDWVCIFIFTIFICEQPKS